MKRSRITAFINALSSIRESITDEEALSAPALFPEWKTGAEYTVGTRLYYNGKLYRVEQLHTSQNDWIPDITPALYTEVAEPGTIPVWRQPTGAQDAYMTGDKIIFEEHVYESLIDNNIWSPSAYPAGWKLVE